MSQANRNQQTEGMAATVESLQKENAKLRHKVDKLTKYIDELEAFLKDEAAVYEDAASADPLTEIRTFSRGKETAFQYVLDILKKLKPDEDQTQIVETQDMYYEKEIKLGNTISFFYSPSAETAASLKVIFKERAANDPENLVEMIRFYLKQMPENLNSAINMTFVP